MGLIPLGFWAASGAGGGAAESAYELISTTILGSSAASVTFSGLGTSAAAYKHLQIRVTGRSDRGANGDGFGIRFNGDSGANYARHYLYGEGTGVFSGSNTAATFAGAINVTASTSPASVYSTGVVDVLDFANVSKYTTVRNFNGTPAAGYFVSLGSGLWLNTAAITDITLYCISGNMVTGSRFSLYGLK